MGTTIRREPITTSIPAAPDYRFLNITNFGGIEKSSNPFVVESNTASDCLNVYVDEDNALSTRPRLNFVQNLITIAMEQNRPFTTRVKPVGVYSTHNGYLLHVIDGKPYLHLLIIDEKGNFIDGKTINNVPETLTEKIRIFEQNDTIYVLTGNSYKKIENYTMSDVEGYIPTTRIAKNKRTVTKASDGTISVEYDLEGIAFESVNIISDKYKESYFWDGTYGTESLKKTENDTIENNYVINKEFELKNSDGSAFDGELYKIIPWVYDTEKSLFYYLARVGLDVVVLAINKNGIVENALTKKVFSGTESLFDYDFKNNIACSDNGLTVVLVNKTTKTISYYRRNNFTDEFSSERTLIKQDSEFLPNHLDDNKSISVSNDGKAIWWRDSSNKSTYAFTDEDGRYFTHESPHEDTSALLIAYTIKDDYLLLREKSDSYGVHTILVSRYTRDEMVSESSTDKNLNITQPWSPYSERIHGLTIKISNNGVAMSLGGVIKDKEGNVLRSGIWQYPTAYMDDGSIYYMNSGHRKVVEEFNDYWSDIKFVYGDNNNYCYLNTQDNSGRFLNTLNEDILLSLDLKTQVSQFTKITGEFITNINQNKMIITKYDLESTEPLLIITRMLNETDEFDIEKHTELFEIFKNSDVCQRFDNNTWFASNNYTFHTLYNNPAYIPLSGYNDLGESHSRITGLSIVNDNILAAYKNNKIYIITPITVGDNITYSYTETKNVIGNDVINAPILTILTEMPILISYDGVYALNQLENVQSSDRITTLISEKINPKWLKEPKEDINRCLTINRLYWTYFILPHKKIENSLSDDKNYTKIYLLDNRTGSWFYWELPVLIISAMVKNNKTHFVDDTCCLYTLETSDLINKYNSQLTEYYDVVDANNTKTLIPWYWTSQILSLNTINYSKRLVDTTFVLTDTDTSDEYALNYKFKAFRKNKNAETTELTLTNDIEYVESITKRTMIPRFNFLQFTLSNTEDDQKLNNNKLRLVGLGLKYVLLGGLY